MIYEFNGKFYVRPFSNKLVEVEITKKDGEFDVKATPKEIMLNNEIQSKMAEVTLEYAYEKLNRGKKASMSTI